VIGQLKLKILIFMIWHAQSVTGTWEAGRAYPFIIYDLSKYKFFSS
jgi:hypothetical protein